MFTEDDLKSKVKEFEDAMQQMVANYNVLQGKLSVVNEMLSKFAPGVVKIEKGIGEVISGVSDVAAGVIDVAAEVTI